MKQFYPNRFKDKVIILTGAARGIGEATAIRAAKEGAKLVLVDRLKEEGERVLDAVRAEGGTAIFLNLDLSAEEHAAQMVDMAVKAYGHLDIAINNAGVMGNPSPPPPLKQEERGNTIATKNFFLFFFC